MLILYFVFVVLPTPLVTGSFETLFSFKQAHGYVDVRQGAHMFYWLFYTTAPVENYTERPLVVWLQGGPGGSSTAIGNFEMLGPVDLNLEVRNTSWVKDFNVLFVDNPVGTGYSYVDNFSFLTTTNDQIALDFVELIRGVLNNHPEFKGVPLYIYGQSYGGKMAVDMGIRLKEAERNGDIESNLKGIAMGNAWISPVDSTLTWGPLLLAAGLVDQAGHDYIQVHAMRAEEAFNQGQYQNSTNLWRATQRAVFRTTHNVDFYDILAKYPANASAINCCNDDMEDETLRRITIEDGFYSEERQTGWTMNTPELREFLNIPSNVVWGAQSGPVFTFLETDFMKPVTEGIEKLLNETDIIVQKYNGNLDLICDTPGQILWVDRLRWEGAETYKNSPRRPIWENGRLEGYYKAHGNFRFFWINLAGHSVPRDNPEGTRAFLRDMTTYG